jgi:geranylgeranylglycerol-phosphate geranylgeranyltransferase
MPSMMSNGKSGGDVRLSAPFPGAAFWKAYVVTMRPYLVFVSSAAGLVGLAFIEFSGPGRLALGFTPLFLSYGFGQALTDCFQTDTDSLSAPYRPLVRGVVTRTQVMAVSLSGLGGGLLVLAWLNPANLVFGALAVAGLLAYTFFKRRWWGGPFWNSWIVALLPLMGRLVEKGTGPADLLDTPPAGGSVFLASVAAVFLGYANFVVMGYFKDISADRATGYRTLPVVFGWRAAAAWSDVLAFFFIAAVTAVVVFSGTVTVPGLVALAAAAGCGLAAQIGIHRTREETEAHGPISHVVRSFLLGTAAVVLTLRAEWLAPIAVFYLLFELALKFRPERRQV